METPVLICTQCHSRFTEACFRAWQRCPYHGCDGELRTEEPPRREMPPPAPKTPRDHAAV